MSAEYIFLYHLEVRDKLQENKLMSVIFNNFSDDS